MDFTHLKELVNLFNEGTMSKLEVKNGDFSLCLEKQLVQAPLVQTLPLAINTAAPQQAAPVVTQSAQPSQEVVQISGEKINSPMVGTFYRSPSPGADAFVKVGSIVRKGSPVGIIEAMKIMNEIEAEFDCKIVEMLVEDGQPVEYDMPLFRVERV